MLKTRFWAISRLIPKLNFGVVLFILFSLYCSTPIHSQHRAFKPGELLKYSIYYGPIRGGEAVLEVRNGSYGGKRVNHLYLNGRTVGLANVLYNVNDTYQSFTSIETDLPYKAIRDIKEGGYKHYSEQIFDHWTREDSTIVHSTVMGEVLAPKNSNDILSAFYYIRNQIIKNPPKIGDTIVVQTYFTDEIYRLRVRFVGYENVKTRIGTINCLKLIPIVITGRVFKNEDDMTVWFSNDNNYLPVRVRFNIVIGAAYCDLIEFSGLMHPLTSRVKEP